MRKLLYILLGVVGFIVMALFLAPWFVDLNPYKHRIETEVTQRLGRQMTIEGDLSLTLLPFPSVSASQIRLGNSAKSQTPDMLKISKISASFAWLPLLKKQVSIQHLDFLDPEILLETYRDKSSNWDFLVDFADALQDSPVDPNASKPPHEKSDLSFHINRMNIQNGYIKYVEGQSVTVIEQLNLSLEARELFGPYRVKGRLKVGEHPLDVQLTANEFSTEKPIDLELKLQYGPHRLSSKGQFAQQTNQYNGQLEGSIRLDEFGNAIHERVGKTLTYSGTLQADRTTIQLSQLNFTLDQFQAEGNMRFGLDKDQKYLIELKHLPGQTHLKMGGTLANLNPLSGHVQFESKQLGTLLESIKISVTDIPQPALGPLSMSTNFKMSGDDFSLSQLVLKSGTAELTGGFERRGNQIIMDLQTSQIGSWLAYAKMQPKQELGSFHIRGTASGDLQQLKLDTNLEFLQGHFSVRGDIKDLMGSFSYNVNANMKHANLNRLLDRLGLQDFPLTITGVDLTAGLEGNSNQVKFSNFQGSIAPKGHTTQISGHGTYRFATKRPQLELNLQLGHLNLNALLAENQAADFQSKRQAMGQSQIILASMQSSSSFTSWSAEPIDFSALNLLDANVQLKLASLSYPPYVLNDVNASITLSKGTLTIPDFSASVYGGNLTGQFTLQASKAVPALSLTAELKGATLKRLIGGDSQWDIAGGTTNMDVNLTTAGKSEMELVSHLNGAVNFELSNATLIGADYGALAKTLMKLTSPGGLSDALGRTTQAGQTTSTNVKGRFNIVNGVARTNDTQFTSPPANGSAEGEMNLPKYTMDMKANIQLVDLKNLPVEVILHGPLNSPQIKYNTKELQQKLFRNVGGQIINRLLGGAAGGPIGAATGLPKLPIPIPGLGTEKDTQAQDPKAGTEKTKPPAPEKILKGVIKGLFN